VSVRAATSPAAFLGRRAHLRTTVVRTAEVGFKRSAAYFINVLRMPLGPLAIYAVAYFAYQAAGRASVDGTSVSGFLLVGMFGHVTVTSAVWWGGSAIEQERFEGTIGALFLSPASRIAVVLGHGLAGFIFLIPSFVVVGLLGVATGARLNVESPGAVVVSALVLLIAALALGFLLSALFVLTRRANLMANVIQHPIYLLGGFVIPREELPRALRIISDTLPVAHAVDAFRASTLSAGSLSDIAPTLLAALATSAICAVIGALGMQRIEYAAKRSGQLELY
jgi:ABC-2 type transport system permease protein